MGTNLSGRRSGWALHRTPMTTSEPKIGRKPKLDKKVEEDLIAENQRLRAENVYLKKSNALVDERVRREKNLTS